ncbi:ATPase [Aurantiacibacter atlanticus]|uniref:ATPase n=2 Tax=Aurantiacibacter atlanticus TaxID=1648404 RepID=A0A168M214_9SPHN|nr:ATPase [Aurantiacibacter atlanticus]
MSLGDGNETLTAPTFGQDEHDADIVNVAEPASLEEGAHEEEFWEKEAPSRPRGLWIVPTFAALAILGWTGFFGWVHLAEITAGASAEQWSQWIVNWSVPVLLVIGLWMLAMRNSRREANRFTDAARALSYESAQLETRLVVVNRELSLAREFIASQSRDLETLGRVAAERLSSHADHLQALVKDNSAQVELIGVVSDNAVHNMEHLRDQLPVLTNAARDMSNQIGNAGNVAHQQISALVDGFDRLNQFGEIGERHVTQIGEKVSATLTSFDHQVAALGDVTQARFGKLREVSEAFRTDMVKSEDAALASLQLRADELATTLKERNDQQREAEDAAIAAMQDRLAALTVQGDQLLVNLDEERVQMTGVWTQAIAGLEARMGEALDHISHADEKAMEGARQRLAALSEEAGLVDARITGGLAAFDSELERRREEIASREARELAELDTRISDFDKRMAERKVEYANTLAVLAERSEGLFGRVSEIDDNMRRLAREGEDTHGMLGEAADEFADRLAQSRAALEENSGRIAKLTDDGVRLLEIIRSGGEYSESTLANSIDHAEAKLASFMQEAVSLKGLVEDAEARGETLAAHVGAANETSSSTLGHLQALELQIGTVTAESEKLAERTGNELREALQLLSGSASEALDSLRENQQEVIEEIAGKISEQSRDRVAEAIKADTQAAIAELDDAISQAAARGHETTTALRDQLARVNELAANLEQRISYARERAEENVDGDFSRRIALITEALNSSSIDIAKAFDNEVSDTQWMQYLRGDRGIFTRSAVRMLDRQDSRAVADIYGEDSDFRETVNRFIHDFESMLREVLSTRDGNALAVTLLSSDAGKLYVALAQAIDRLRA